MIDYDEEWLLKLVFTLRGSVSLRALWFAVPAAILAFLLVLLDRMDPDAREAWGLLELGKSQLWAASTGIVASLLMFRINRAMARFWEGTGLLHQMRGEWFDSISCCVTFSRAAVASKPKEVEEFRHIIVRMMSLCHGSALEEIACQSPGTLHSIDPYGLSNVTLEHLSDCTEIHGFNRVEVLLHLIQSLITKSLDEGVLKIPPPILSRVYQTLSRGFVNLLNAKKIADTRFPFPFAQVIAYFLILHTVLTPLLISSLFTSLIWAPLFTFLPIFVMASLNLIGTELENPFGNDENDLPMDHFQSEMNLCLMMLLHWNADLLPALSDERCVKDFGLLECMMKDTHHGHDMRDISELDAESCPTRLNLSGFSGKKADEVARISQTKLKDVEARVSLTRPQPKVPKQPVEAVAPPAAAAAPPAPAPPAPAPPAPAPAPAPAAPAPPPPPEPKKQEVEPLVSKSIDDLNSMLKQFFTQFHEAQAAWSESMTTQLQGLSQNSSQTSKALREMTDRLGIIGTAVHSGSSGPLACMSGPRVAVQALTKS